MKKVFAAIAVFAGIALANEASAQTRYGITQTTKNGNRTTYTCPQTATTICQIWGNNADGTRYVIVRLVSEDGTTRSFSIGVKKATPPNDGEPKTYIIDPEMKDVVWEATEYVEEVE
jgi:hypothetical protein